MQFHASKIVSALILLNTTICLAMQRGSGYDPFKIGIAFATCGNRVYNSLQISSVIKEGLRSIRLLEGSNINLDVVQYTPKPTEVMPSKDKFYFNRMMGPNVPQDFVIFSRDGLFAKVVTRVLDGQRFKYMDCVPSQTTPSPQELQPILEFPRQNSGEHDPFGIGITSVSCEGRDYIKLEISMAIIRGMRSIARLNKIEMSLDVMQYKPMPTEVMPSQGKFYYSELTKLGPNGPVDLVIFSLSGQFAKVVIRKKDGDDPVHKDCVSSSNRQSPERTPSRMVSPERSQLRTKSSKRRRLTMKFPEQESLE